MDIASDVTSIAHVIQLSIAPVFLLTAVGAMLGVLSSRLSRAVDPGADARGPRQDGGRR